MKKIFIISASFLALYFLVSVLPIRNEAAIYDETVRLHVIANSDSEYDQSLKLYVRDRVLECVAAIVANSENADDASAVIVDSREIIAEAAREAVADYGSNQELNVSFGLEEYPTRYYDEFALPAGEYRSLIVRLGDAEGKNWWCVLFPRLCTSACVENKHDVCLSGGYSEEQYNMIRRDGGVKYKIRFRVLEFFERLF